MAAVGEALPAAVSQAPGASRSVVGLRLEKQVTLSATMPVSVQPSTVVLPRVVSQTAPTEIAFSMQAGACMSMLEPVLPVETVTAVPCPTRPLTTAA